MSILSNFSVFVIAEAGVNHNGSLKRALDMVDAAASIGAHAVKFQSFAAKELATSSVAKCDYQSLGTEHGSQMSMLEKMELSEEDHFHIYERCKLRSIEFMSTAFDPKNLIFLIKNFKIKRIKIPSGELTNPILLLTAAKTKLPIILSTGMSSIGEIEWALKIIIWGDRNKMGFPNCEDINNIELTANNSRKILRERISILQCTTSYPTQIKDVNLNVIDTFKNSYPMKVGFSDHTLGKLASLMAVAKGATIIEKHLTLDRNLPGPDHKASLEPYEMKEMIEEIEFAVQMLGVKHKEPCAVEIQNKKVAARKIVAKKKIIKGDIFSLENLCLKRADKGVSSMRLSEILGLISDAEYDFDDPVFF